LSDIGHMTYAASALVPPSVAEAVSFWGLGSLRNIFPGLMAAIASGVKNGDKKPAFPSLFPYVEK
jgi:hypothetical protein